MKSRSGGMQCFEFDRLNSGIRGFMYEGFGGLGFGI